MRNLTDTELQQVSGGKHAEDAPPPHGKAYGRRFKDGEPPAEDLPNGIQKRYDGQETAG